MKNTKTKAVIIILSICVLAYLGVAIYFTKHFLFNTYVNEIEAFNKTAEELEKLEEDRLKEYSLTVNSRGDIAEILTSDQIQLFLEIGNEFTDALKQQKAAVWPAYLFKKTSVTTDNIVTYSPDVVERIVSDMKIFDESNIKEPVDAHISEDVNEDGFYVVSEDPGRTPIKKAVFEEVCAALDVLDSEMTLSDECFEEAKIKSDDAKLGELCTNLNKYCKAVITYEFGDETVVADGTVIKDWCDIQNTKVELNRDKVRDFVNSIARKYDSFGKKRTFRTHEGENIEIEGGDYGWWMDRQTETSELMEAAEAGEKVTRTPVYFQSAASYDEKDYGDSYVEVDLTAQHLWVYQEGRVVIESDFVSGCVNKNHATPRGTYGITYKERDATLVGENYSSPVKYWMPFNGNVGMHDASWRSEFGGEIYITNGSHGCINLPSDVAAKIFDIVEKGEAVIVYGGETVPRIPVQEIPADGLNPDGTPIQQLNPDGTPVVQQNPEAAPADQAAPVITPVEGANPADAIMDGLNLDENHEGSSEPINPGVNPPDNPMTSEEVNN